MTDREKLENIAEVALLRTGLVKIKHSNEHDYDFIVYDKNEPSKIMGVEVKKVVTKEVALKAYQNTKNKFSLSYTKKIIPIILFLIDPERESGFFSIFDENHNDKISSLKMDIFTKQLRQSLKIYPAMEFPPYTFHQKSDDAKYEATAFVDGKFRALRLHNISLSPIDDKFNLNLKIVIEGNGTKKIHKPILSTLFSNDKLHNYLFFVNKGIPYTDLLLPPGNKRITFEFNLVKNIEKFDAQLNCEYLTE